MIWRIFRFNLARHPVKIRKKTEKGSKSAENSRENAKKRVKCRELEEEEVPDRLNSGTIAGSRGDSNGPDGQGLRGRVALGSMPAPPPRGAGLGRGPGFGGPSSGRKSRIGQGSGSGASPPPEILTLSLAQDIGGTSRVKAGRAGG